MQQLKSEECKIRPQRSDNASNPRNVLNSSTETCTYTGKKNSSSSGLNSLYNENNIHIIINNIWIAPYSILSPFTDRQLDNATYHQRSLAVLKFLVPWHLMYLAPSGSVLFSLKHPE